MDHAVTVGEVLSVVGAVAGLGLVFLIAVGLLWFMAQGWNH